MTFFVWGLKTRAWVSPPQPRVSHIVEVAASIAQAASTALPPRSNIIAPGGGPERLARDGHPVTAVEHGLRGGGLHAGAVLVRP